MRTISIKTEPKELEYLARTAEKNSLFTGDNNEISLGKALKKILQWCAYHDIDIAKSHDVFDEDMRKMIEQIHVSMPNLMYLSRMATLFSGDGISQEKSEQFKKTSLEYINNTCGAFQDITYNNLRVSINPFGLKQIPIEKEKTLWR